MATVIQRSLSGGELDPALWARTDTSKYATGLRTLRNMFVRRSGGASSRPGTVLVSAVKDSSKNVRLFEFVFNLSQTYILEFGDKYIRFHQNGSPVLVSGVATYAGGTTYAIADLVVSGGVNYYCIQAGSGHTPASSPTFWYPLTGNIYEIPTPYLYTDLPAIRYAQTNDVMTITHPSYPQQELARAGQTNWTLIQIVFGSEVFPPTSLTNNGGTSTSVTFWAVTSIDATTGEEGALVAAKGASAGIGGGFTGVAGTSSSDTPTAGAPIKLSWTYNTSASAYNIYRSIDSGAAYGFIGTTVTNTFIDDGIIPDPSHTFPQGANPFNASNTYPTACAYYQQKIIYSNSNNNPTKTWGSSTGLYHNFNTSFPVIATDSLSFSMAGARDAVQHLLDLGVLITFTAGAENAVLGDPSTNALTPSATNPKLQSVNGCSQLRPLVVGEFAVYNQARGSIVRDLGFNFQVDGYRGDDLTIFASHLFDNYTLVDWCYQQIPHSIIWAARSDGTLLAMTYIREQQILAWHHHDFDGGIVENVASIPEGNEDAVYLVIKRVINGSTVRFIERLSTAKINNVVDYVGMDCANTFDGRNTTSDTVTVSGGTLWSEVEPLTVTLNANNFITLTSLDATNNNVLLITGADGSLIRFKITAVSSGTVATGFADRTVPASLRSTATASWSKAVSHLSGLGYLEGQTISVFGDGYVVGSPNNSAYPVYTVTSGATVLDKHYAVIHVGLPITADIETLDIDTPGSVETITNKFKNVQEVTIHVLNSRGIFVGPNNPDTDLTNTTNDPLYRLTEEKVRQYENYDSPVSLVTGKITQVIQSEWNSNGHVFIRQVDPVPMTILAIAPDGLFPLRGGG